MIKGFEEAGEKYDVIEDKQEIRSRSYTPIFGTKYYWDVPYLVDVEKYKKAFKTEITEGYGGTLSLTSEIEDGYQVVWAYSSKHKENDGDWTSDCFQCHYDKLEDFVEFVKKITDTFIGVDNIAVFKKCIRLEEEINNITKQKQALLQVSGNNGCEYVV